MAKTATATPSFASLLDKPASIDDRPKTQPQGSWLCLVKGLPFFDKSSQKLTEFAEFTLQVLAAGVDVDENDLEAWLTKADGSKKVLTDQIIKHRLYLTDNSIFMLNDFLDHCGTDDSKTRRDRIDDTPNCEVVVYIRHESRKDGQGVQSKVAKTAPAEDFNAQEAA